MLVVMVTCDFTHPAVIHDTVERLELTVADAVLVQVGHSSGDVCGKGESAAELR